MQCSEPGFWEWRSIERAARARILLLLLLPLLSGCLPGFKWGDDEDNMPVAGTQGAPALNRDYKSNFLSLQMPSLGVSSVQGQLMPDIGPSILSAFSTVETRKAAAPRVPSRFATGTEASPGFEPAVLPPAKSLANFYAALAALASGRHPQPVTILHFGDGHIAYDRFAGALRDHLIGRFGSAGRGVMMPGLFPVRGMKEDRSGQWSLQSAAAGAPGPFGITGVRMTATSSEAWLRFTAAQGSFDWAEVSFMTGPGFGTAVVGLDGDARLVSTNAAAANETSIRLPLKSRELLIKPRGDGPISVLSAATGTNTPGIAYSNLGLPEATAATPAKWTPDFAANELQKLNPDLILLEYGTREVFDDRLDIRQYEMRLRLIADQIKQWAPQASILIVGPPDAARLPGFAGSAGAQVCRALNLQEIAVYDRMMERADERLARWHTPPMFDAVRTALRRAAASTGAYYWDWAKYMGGPCSIHAWASYTPPLAEPDHITLTEAGDDRSARALFAEIMAGYDAYQRGLQAKAQALVAAAEIKAQRPPAGKKRKAKAQQ
ncbi:MAG: hypothetical protein ACLPJW_14840 [Rhodomicrobium sp.]